MQGGKPQQPFYTPSGVSKLVLWFSCAPGTLSVWRTWEHGKWLVECVGPAGTRGPLASSAGGVLQVLPMCVCALTCRRRSVPCSPPLRSRNLAAPPSCSQMAEEEPRTVEPEMPAPALLSCMPSLLAPREHGKLFGSLPLPPPLSHWRAHPCIHPPARACPTTRPSTPTRSSTHPPGVAVGLSIHTIHN